MPTTGDRACRIELGPDNPPPFPPLPLKGEGNKGRGLRKFKKIHLGAGGAGRERLAVLKAISEAMTGHWLIWNFTLFRDGIAAAIHEFAARLARFRRAPPARNSGMAAAMPAMTMALHSR